jgi:hypothetical protein
MFGTILVLVFGPSLLSFAALADGCMVARKGVTLRVPEQTALIVLRDGWEDLVISVRYDGAPEEFGWIVPVPSVPELFAEDQELFELLRRATEPFERPRREAPNHRRFGMMAAGATTVLKEEAVGVFDACVLRSTDGADLESWLKQHDFVVPPGGQKVLDRYIARGWVFAAFKIRPGGERGVIQPVRLRFRSEKPIFPLEISSIPGTPAEVVLYCVSHHGYLEPTGFPLDRWVSSHHAGSGRRFGFRDYSSPEPSPEFPPPWDGEYYLSKHRAVLQAGEMKDVIFEPSRW